MLLISCIAVKAQEYKIMPFDVLTDYVEKNYPYKGRKTMAGNRNYKIYEKVNIDSAIVDRYYIDTKYKVVIHGYNIKNVDATLDKFYAVRIYINSHFSNIETKTDLNQIWGFDNGQYVAVGVMLNEHNTICVAVGYK